MLHYPRCSKTFFRRVITVVRVVSPGVKQKQSESWTTSWYGRRRNYHRKMQRMGSQNQVSSKKWKALARWMWYATIFHLNHHSNIRFTVWRRIQITDSPPATHLGNSWYRTRSCRRSNSTENAGPVLQRRKHTNRILQKLVIFFGTTQYCSAELHRRKREREFEQMGTRHNFFIKKRQIIGRDNVQRHFGQFAKDSQQRV